MGWHPDLVCSAVFPRVEPAEAELVTLLERVPLGGGGGLRVRHDEGRHEVGLGGDALLQGGRHVALQEAHGGGVAAWRNGWQSEIGVVLLNKVGASCSKSTFEK